MNQKSYAWYFTGLSVIPNQKYSMLAIVCSPKMPDKQHKNSIQKKRTHTCTSVCTGNAVITSDWHSKNAKRKLLSPIHWAEAFISRPLHHGNGTMKSKMKLQLCKAILVLFLQKTYPTFCWQCNSFNSAKERLKERNDKKNLAPEEHSIP